MAVAPSFPEFQATFKMLCKEILEDDELFHGETTENRQKLLEIFEYNVPPLAKLRGFILVKAYAAVRGQSLTREDLDQVYILGWLQQGIQSFSFVMDDYLDGDMSRWGKPTWFAINNGSVQTLTDAIRLEGLIYKLLYKHFRHLPMYPELNLYFQNSITDFFAGQHLEEIWSYRENQENRDLSNMTMEKYLVRTRLMSTKIYTHGSFQLPLIFANNTDPVLADQVMQFCNAELQYTSTKDDLHDSFDPENNLANPCEDRDIKKGVPKLLIIKAIELCTPEQLERIKASLGKDNDVDAALVKAVYEEIGLPGKMVEYMKQQAQQIKEMVANLRKEGCVLADEFEKMLKIVVDSNQT